MGLLSFNPGNFSDALAGLSQGLLAYGSGQPQGLLTVPAVVARSRQDRLQNTRQQQLLDMEQQKFQQEQTEFQRRLAHDQQMQSAWAGLTGTGATGPNNGRPGGVAPQQSGILSSLSPDLQTYLKALPPEQGMEALGGLLTQKPDKPHLVQAYINGHMEYVPEDQAAGLQSAAPERPPQGPGPSPLEIRAAGAGLVPGTPEYKKFMLTGGEQQAGVDPKDEGTLRKEFNDLPEVKSFNTVAPIYNSMVEAGKRNTRASDLNLVYGLAKIMDPGSVVREGEQVMVMNTASLPDWLVGQINRYNGGSALEGNTRRAIMAEAKSRMDQMAAQVEARRQQYTSLGSDYGYDPNHIVGSPYSIQTPSFSVAPRGGQPMGGADAILDRYKVPQ